MMQYVALVRGINVGGKNLVSMFDLREFLKALGFTSPRSRLQSGNLLFGAKEMPTLELEEQLAAEAQKRLKRQLTFIVRDQTQWRKLMADNPFTHEAETAPARLAVMCLKDQVDPKAVTGLIASVTTGEKLRHVNRELYLVYPNGIGQSRLTGGMIERKLGTVGTARNWNTVLKIAEAL